jgi:hypothetical protein
MKLLIKIMVILTLICSLLANKSEGQENIVGSWVVSSSYDYWENNDGSYDERGYVNYQLKFDENGIATQEILSSQGINYGHISFAFSVPALNNCNGELQTYVTGEYYYDNQSQISWPIGEYNGGFFGDVALFSVPEQENEYMLIYSATDNEGGGGTLHGRDIVIEKIEINNGTPIFSFVEGINVYNPQIGNYNSGTLAVSHTIDDRRVLFVILAKNWFTGIYGLMKYKIESNGVFYEETLLEDSEGNGVQSDELQHVYNLEMQNKYAPDDHILGWITAPYDANYYTNIYEENLYIFNDGDLNIYDLQAGKLAGIEFSPFESEMIYVSTQNLGLIKVDWQNGDIVEVLSTNFSHTAIQRAPDGNLYAVSDDGIFLGQINKETLALNETYFEYPENSILTPSTHINFSGLEEDGVRYFSLPDNDFAPVNSHIITTNEICDGGLGSATITVKGGVPDYTLIVERLNEEDNWVDVEELFNFNNDNQSFECFVLQSGTYRYNIEDYAECQFDDWEYFEIGYEATYDFNENMLEINEDDAEDIQGLEDMIWDPSDGFANNTIQFKHGFVLEAPLTLTVNNMELQFDQENQAKIIVKPGAKLILNNSILTNHVCLDDAKWVGIEVWGNPNASQEEDENGNYQQGYLELMNGATIENAQTAVALRKEGTWASHGGGIVKAYDANFINNAKSVHFAPYQNMFFREVDGQTLEFEMLNESRFELCNFEVNENYFDDSEFFKHADIVQVHRIPFIGCNFSVSGTESASTYNSAIAAYSAGVNVDQYDSETPSTFTGFYCGIVSTHDASTNVYYSMVQNSNFINNSVGIRNTGTNNFKIIDNHFEIGENNGGKGACGWAPGYGVDLRAATGFVIENNSFEPVQGNTGDTYGVRIFETHTDGDEIYKNEYSGLSVGNLSDGLNVEDGEDPKGLSYLCNENSNNTKDFLITGIDSEIFINQGSASMGAGNTFSSTATMHLENTGTEGFNYYKFGTGPDPTKCTPPPKVNIQNASGANSCPDHYGGSGGGIGLDPIGRQATEDEFNEAKTNYNAVESLYASLTDGGNTEGTELTIAAAQPSDTWELRANLLGMSPYLSKEVLIEAADKTDVLPESVLFEILSANPDELKKGELMEHLENKEEPLPDYMIEILKQMAAGTTAKTALLSQMGEYKSLEISKAKEIIHSILIEEELDHEDLRTWLANLESYNGDRQIISSFIAQGDINSAQALMDLLPELYELNGDALSEHNEWADLMNMHLNWQAEGRNPTDLTEAELAALYNLADNGGTKAKYQARGILEHFYGENYIDCCTPPDGNKSTVTDFSKNDFAKAMGLSMEAHPNPAKEYTEISYTLPFGVENAILSIFDMSGKLIEQMQLNSPINKLAYNTSRLPAGSYTIEIKTNDYSYATKLIVQ